MADELTWEVISRTVYYDQHRNGSTDIVLRAKVPGGWLVRTQSRERESHFSQNVATIAIGLGDGITFLPDPNHEWEVAPLAHVSNVPQDELT